MRTPSSPPQSLRLLEAAVEAYGPLITLPGLEAIAARRGLNRRQVIHAISTLARQGWLEILKRGVYLVKSPLFAEEVHPFAIAAALVSPCAISHWSALAHHGFTNQMPRMVQVATPVRVVTPEMRRGGAYRPRGRPVWQAGGIEVEFVYVSPERFWGHQSLWVNRWHQVTITDAERTALDLIARPALFGGMRAALELLEAALPHIQVERLVNYALRYGEGATIKRLGWALERMGEPSQHLESLRAVEVKTYYRLDPQQPPNHRYNARWRLIENLKGEESD
uniref:Hypothetical conserved protein n=1 Tax=uncultured Chloroflexota bacterium TaxID=166587 RepID=H5SBE6_9CHLR|nr:hypothetical conserved protein [uncultured Chloroflexota bacterium]